MRGMDWIVVAADKEWLQVCVNTVINLQVHKRQVFV